MEAEFIDTTVFLPKEKSLQSLRSDIGRVFEIYQEIHKRWPRFFRALFQGERVKRRVKRRLKYSDISQINALLQELSEITNRIFQEQQAVALQYPDLVDTTDEGMKKYHSVLARISSYIKDQQACITLGISLMAIFGVFAQILPVVVPLAPLPWFLVYIGGLLLFGSFVNRIFFRKMMLKDSMIDILAISEKNPSVAISFMGWITYDSSREAKLVRSAYSSVLLSGSPH